MSKIIIAVAKGRILKEAIPLLRTIGIELDHHPDATRKLLIATNNPQILLIIVRASDVPTYVEYGSADIGITGRDVLLEQGNHNIYEPLDLKIATCKMVVAAPIELEAAQVDRRIRVATKYVNITHDYFFDQGKQVEIIKLYGSMELAPRLGLADQIVDLIDTGNTLKANNLFPLEEMMPISAQLIVNKASMRVKREIVQTMIKKFVDAIAEK